MLAAYSKMLVEKKIKNIADLDKMLALSDDELRKDVETKSK